MALSKEWYEQNKEAMRKQFDDGSREAVDAIFKQLGRIDEMELRVAVLEAAVVELLKR